MMFERKDGCIFCDIVSGSAPAKFVKWDYWNNHSVIFEPLNPVTPGHLLVVPKDHVEDFTDDPAVSGDTMEMAAAYAKTLDMPMNLITSKGREATQSVFHLHIHLVPRHKDDGLALPWYSGKGNHD